ncbi:acyltransferase [Streptomyces sp. CB01201]|uniref:acyltransferase family protein n=1 Tax=Streptomyces sp. CB01201 TaxID=2020324 RepID=UPI000C271C3B|nr:acyltransferase [Streptomyces sp. CB01201]PJM98695.1 acyltransferase [Streptomyces sp. CB01201]
MPASVTASVPAAELGAAARSSRLRRAAGPRTSRAPSGAGRLAAVDGLRLFAAAGVAAYHYLGTPTPRFWGETYDLPQAAPLLHAISGYGWLGVEAFFLISGFVICMSCWGRTPAQFAVSRIARLFPLYWAVVLIIVVMGTVTVLVGQRSGAPTDLRTTLGNLTMIPQPLGVDFTAGVAWTLWVEARFYLLMGALLLIGLTYRRVVAFGLLWLVLASVGRELHSTVVDEFLLSQYAGLFVAGIALYLMHRFGHNLLLWLLLGFAWCYTLTVLEDRVATHSTSNWGLSATVLTGFLVLLALACGPLRHLQWRGLVHAGALTYPFYLVHQSLGIPATRGVLKSVPGLGLLPSIAVGLSFSLLLAALLNHQVDRRFGRAFRRHLTAALDPAPVAPDRPSRGA